MSKKSLIITSALIAAVSSGATMDANAKEVKCYGVSKAGKNACNWPGGTCFGSSKYTCNGNAWTTMTKEECLKTTCTSDAGREVKGSLVPQDFINPDA